MLSSGEVVLRYLDHLAIDLLYVLGTREHHADCEFLLHVFRKEYKGRKPISSDRVDEARRLIANGKAKSGRSWGSLGKHW